MPARVRCSFFGLATLVARSNSLRSASLGDGLPWRFSRFRYATHTFMRSSSSSAGMALRARSATDLASSYAPTDI